jgi:mono/diheme cytochrome c family protein
MQRLVGLAALVAALSQGAVEFNRDVRPILSDKCFGCHGPDAKTKNIPLRLDIEDQAKADLGKRFAIVPGQPENSEIIKRITAEQIFKKMPPPSSGHAVSEAELATLKQWISEGAKWQKHWSFLPVTKPTPPQTSNNSWSRNAIDRFLLARLDKEGLKPSPEASKEKLLRRVTLDLTGLPPTPEEQRAFLADSSTNAYEKVIDRLLATPAFGERLAARWLENARYADSNGYQFDGERVMWRWRDYVIDSFHKNKPFNQFIVEQVAGDLMPNATREQIVGTGFNRNHRGNTEFGIVPEEYAVEYVVDRVETTSAVFLGLTMGCARCHNHKYDPFTQKEFYQFYAYFNNIPENGRAMKYGNSPPLIAAPTKEEEAGLAALDRKIRAAEESMSKRRADIDRLMSNWEKSGAAKSQAYWLPLTNRRAKLSFENPDETRANMGEVRFVPGRVGNAVELKGGAYLDAGFDAAPFDIEDRFTITASIKSDTMPNGAIFSRMDDKPKGRGFGLEARQGKIHVHFTSDFDDDAIRMDSEAVVLQANTWQHVALTFDGSRMAEGVRVYVDGKPVKLKTEIDSLYRPFVNAGNRFPHPFRMGAGGGPERRFTGLIDEVAIWSRVLAPDAVAILGRVEALSKLAAIDPAKRDASAWRQLRGAFLESAAPAELRDEQAKLNALYQDREAMERSFPTVMVMKEMTERRPTTILLRGEYNKPGEHVEPGLPSMLPPLPSNEPNNRLGLARWMVGKDNPLTARVTVNRFWQMIFGTGLVKTSEDFGSQGEWPSHPELLDWLAADFMESGWNTKALFKQVLSSAAYRQDSKVSPDLLNRDPENRLLARGPRLRLPAETVRDQALAASGLLSAKVGGPSVKPYQPAGLWEEQSMQNMYYTQGHGEDLYRRSLYMYWKRTIAPPMMTNFDASTREACAVRENRTNTPLQALNLMNDVTFLEAGRQIGRRMLAEGGPSDEAKLRYGFQLVLARAPQAKELEVLKSSLSYHRDFFSSDPKRTEKFLAKGESKLAAGIDLREQAAYMAIGSLLLNLDEAVTKE